MSIYPLYISDHLVTTATATCVVCKYDEPLRPLMSSINIEKAGVCPWMCTVLYMVCHGGEWSKRVAFYPHADSTSPLF